MHLLFGGAAILLDGTQAKSEEDEARQNDQDCESPEHVSHGNSGNSGGVERLVKVRGDANTCTDWDGYFSDGLRDEGTC